MSQILINKSFENLKFPLELNFLIDNAIEKDLICSSIIILPTEKLVRYYTQKIIRAYYDKYGRPISKLQLYNLDNFIKILYNTIFPNIYIHKISEAYRLAIIEEAFEKVELKFFKFGNKPVNFNVIEKLSNVIYGLREDGITLEALKEDIEQAKLNKTYGYDFLKLNDIYELYNYYEKSLTQKVTDGPAIMFRLIDYIKNNSDYCEILNNAFKDNYFIFINGFSEFKQPELEIISFLHKISVPIGISIDYSTENGPLFGNLEHTIIQLGKAGYKLIDKMKLKYQNAPISEIQAKFSSSEFIRANLFYSKDYKNEKTDSLNNIVLICEAEDRTDEVQSIARLVKYLILNYNISPSEICIVMRHPQLYSMLFREQLTRYSIPYNISDRFDLSSSPAIIAIFSVLNLVLFGYLLKDINQVLTSKYIKIEDEEAIDPSNLLNMAQKLRILGGYKRGGIEYWKKRLESAIFIKEKKLLNSDNNEDILEIEGLKREITNLKKAYSDFIKLTESIAFENKNYSPIEFYDIIFEKIIKKLKIYDTISSQYDIILNNNENDSYNKKFLIDNIEKDAQSLLAFKELVEELVYIYQVRYPNKKFKLSDYVSKLRTSATAFRYQIHEKPSYGIDITSIEQIRGLPYKVMILCGAVDGEFPLSYKPEYFLGKELPESEIRHNKAERIQFYQFLTNSPDLLDSSLQKIYIFYPKTEGSKELVASPFINALLKITTLQENGRYIILKDLKKQNRNIKEELYSDSDLKWIESLSAPFEVYKYYSFNFLNNNKTIIEDLTKRLAKNTNICENIEFIKFIFESKSIKKNTKIKIEFDNIITNVDDKIKNSYNKPYSITEFETYALCPFKYFLVFILELKEKEAEELGLTALEKGILLHKILFRFYTTLQKDSKSALNPKIKLVKLEAKQKNYYLSILKKIAEEEIELIQFEHPFFKIEKNAIIGSEEKRGYLEIWLTNELKKIEKDWAFAPGIFEHSFGIHSPNNIEEQSVELNGLRIRGKIDRIEFFENSGILYYLVADYKLSTKNISTNQDIQKGISFQVPLYLLAGRKILNTMLDTDPKPIGGVYYPLIQNYDRKSKKYESFKFVLLPKESHLSSILNKRSSNQLLESFDELEMYLDNSYKKALEIREQISQGFFPIKPQKDACNYCSFNSICRKRKD